MPPYRFLRYIPPNAVTVAGMFCGLLSLVATYEHRFVDAAWLVIWAVLIDRVDGLVARGLKATSEFGVQMDSFADAINFGVAPAFLVFVALDGVEAIGFSAGLGRGFLLVACAGWSLATVVRLAKFNVVPEAPPGGLKVFFGVPTTLAAGVLVIWLLVLLKYAPAGGPFHVDAFGGPRLLDGWSPGLASWVYVPAAMVGASLLMVSNLPIPKLQGFRSKGWTVALVVAVLSGYVCGFARTLPEYMALLPTSWLIVALVWSQFSAVARGAAPPKVLPDPGPLRPRGP